MTIAPAARRLLLLALLALTGCAARPLSATLPLAREIPHARPLFVLLEMNPWLMVIGSDMPSLALYEDGRVIFLRRDSDGRAKGPYLTAQLGRTARDALLSTIGTEALRGLDERYELSACTDMETYAFVTFDEAGTPRVVSAYGALSRREREERRDHLCLTEVEPPVALMTALERLYRFEVPGAQPWTPSVLEVMIWPYEHAPNSVPWPAGWPDLEQAATQPSEKGVGQLYLDGAAADDLREFLMRRGDRTAVLMNGRKWSVSFRYVFPGEARWKPSLPRSH